MKLSTKGRYGVRLMMDLALHYGSGPIFLKDIAERQEISEKYLWQLIPPLKQAGLVSTTRGSHGGYKLAKAPAQITLKEIVSTLEGPLNLVECVDDIGVCPRSSACATRDVWGEVAAKIAQVLESFTLEHLVENQKQKINTLTYSI
jgi:Rrf2 family protein